MVWQEKHEKEFIIGIQIEISAVSFIIKKQIPIERKFSVVSRYLFSYAISLERTTFSFESFCWSTRNAQNSFFISTALLVIEMHQNMKYFVL